MVFDSHFASNYGGAIYLNSAGLTLGTNASFTNNNGLSGADIYVDGQPSAFLLASPLTFRSSQGGRSIYYT